jgi:hypothetical protein
VFETVILQAIAHAPMRQRITSVSAYFDYMRVADTIDSQKSDDRDKDRNYRKCCQRQPKCRECNRKYFTFTQEKFSAAYVRIIIISQFLT